MGEEVMEDIVGKSLHSRQKKEFEKINDLSKGFCGRYCGSTILRTSIFGVISNYARKNNIDLEILRYPFMDDELWAFTFIKRGTLFLCINSQLTLCKQIFAAAHELYHIYCYVENTDQSAIKGGSVLDSRTADELAISKEDLEANAFAGLLLMPDIRMQEQVELFGISGKDISIENILTLMDLFALPFKAVVLRLLEGEIISVDKARELLGYSTKYISERITLSGKARQWQVDSKELVYFGSLCENLEYNLENELITSSREESDKAYLKKLEEGFQKES